MRLGRAAEAAAILERLAAEDPGSVTVLLAAGWALHEAGRDAEALVRYDAAAALAPENKDALYNGGLLLWSAGRLREAADRFARMLAIAPDDSDALFNLGSLELALDDPGAAVDHLGATSSARPPTRTGCCCSRAPGSGSASSRARWRPTTGSWRRIPVAGARRPRAPPADRGGGPRARARGSASRAGGGVRG